MSSERSLKQVMFNDDYSRKHGRPLKTLLEQGHFHWYVNWTRSNGEIAAISIELRLRQIETQFRSIVFNYSI